MTPIPLIFATWNPHKARELCAMLGDGALVLTLNEIGFDREITENGGTFEENARIKVACVVGFLQTTAPWKTATALIVVADDSGLEVDALNGSPGVMSARYGGEPSDDALNIAKLLDAMKGIPEAKRAAQFRCVLAAARLVPSSAHPVKMMTFEGVCRGTIAFQPKGRNGFGYDPVFFPENSCNTFAEIGAREKNAISHRARAVARFKEWLMTANGIRRWPPAAVPAPESLPP